MLTDLFNRKRLQIGCFDPGVEEIDAGRRELRMLLGAIVHQAMDDGMLKIQIGVDRASGEPFMRYFGVRHFTPDKRTWWDMVPPPAYCYTTMLQTCLSLAELDDDLPLKGVIPARKDRKRLNLRLAVNEVESFEIAWDEHDARDRSDEPLVWDGSDDSDSDDR
jgi:hypothetical protein